MKRSFESPNRVITHRLRTAAQTEYLRDRDRQYTEQRDVREGAQSMLGSQEGFVDCPEVDWGTRKHMASLSPWEGGAGLL